MTLNGVMTADERYLFCSWASCRCRVCESSEKSLKKQCVTVVSLFHLLTYP